MSALQLPTFACDIWRQVFAYFDTEPDAFDLWQPLQAQRQLLNIRLVCKTCNNLHASQLRNLTVNSNLPPEALPGLLAWLRKYKPPLETLLMGSQSPVAEAVLAALASSNATLYQIVVFIPRSCSSHLLDMVSAFDSLTGCRLNNQGVEIADLSALQSLPHLTDLILTGSFHKLCDLRHLTMLRLLDNAEVF